MRIYLADAASESSLKLERERRQLADCLQGLEAREESPYRFRERMQKLEEYYGQFKHITPALLMDPEEAAPRPEVTAWRDGAQREAH